MVPEEWPLAADAADRPVEHARARGSRRLASVRHDFFLDPAHRLSEQERALMTSMLHDLIETTAADLVAAVPGAEGRFAASEELIKRLRRSALLNREELVALLLRRADEYRIATMFAQRAGSRALPLLPRLVGDADGAIAAAAMAVVMARGRRRDAFGQPRIELNDLSAGEAQNLLNAVAAALDGFGHGERADLAAAVDALSDRHSATRSLDSAVADLAAVLAHGRRHDDAMIEAAAEDGEASLLAALLARRAGISPDTSWGYLVGGEHGGLALLGRMASLTRPTAARLIAEYASLSGASVEEEIGQFDCLSDKIVTESLGWWSLPAGIRSAAVAIGGPLG